MAAPVTLVTGATGFVGGHLVRELARRGVRVRAAGRDAAALARLAGACGGCVEPVVADLADARAVEAACAGAGAGAETVYHVGALSAPWGRAAEFEAVNVGGTAAVVAGCRRYGVRRLVYVSSPAVVFDGRDHVNGREDAPYPDRFTSVYARTKKEGEDLVNRAAPDLETVIVRPKAVFGPGDRALLPRLVAAARRGRLPQIGDGENRVDLTCVENVVHALLLAGASPGAVGNTYTVTNGESPRLWDVIRRVLTACGVSPPRRRLPLSVALLAAGGMEAVARVTGREPLLTRYTALILTRTQTYDITASRRDLGYAPVVPLDEGIERAVADFLPTAGGRRPC